MTRPYNTLLLLLSVLIIGLTFVGVELYSVLQRHNPDPTAAVQTPTRDEINAAVARLIQAGRAQEVYAFYARDVGDPIKAMLYTSAAITNHAPINLVIAVGWFEGGHLVGLITGPNKDGSRDVSPMGLNSISYKQYSLAELSQLEMNIPTGVVHLVGERIKWGVSWEGALSAYNKGRPSDLDFHQIDYVTAVLKHELELDRRFAIRFGDAL